MNLDDLNLIAGCTALMASPDLIIATFLLLASRSEPEPAAELGPAGWQLLEGGGELEADSPVLAPMYTIPSVPPRSVRLRGWGQRTQAYLCPNRDSR